MSYYYAIDLGIHPDATGGRTGIDKDHAYPLQVALVEGNPIWGENRLYTGFTPTALASFGQIQDGDVLIFRIFDISSICGTPDRMLRSVSRVDLTFTQFDGSDITSEPWQRNKDVAAVHQSDPKQDSPAFTRRRKGMKLPCFFQRDSSQGIVTYTVKTPNTRNPTPYLFSVLVETILAKNTVGTTSEPSEKFYFKDDPEMVISPDEGPGQPPETAATIL